MDYATREQPAPSGDGRSVTDWLTDQLSISGLPGTGPLIEDLLARRELGRGRYGDELRADNGRDASVDAYQELLDAALYLAQLVLEGHAEGAENMLAAICGYAARLREALDQRDAMRGGA